MDDDYDDYSGYSKPRLKLASSAGNVDSDEGQPSQGLKAAYCSVGVAFIALGVVTTGVVQFFALWVALGFIIGPFSPLKVTGGNCCIGLGGDVEFDEDEEDEDQADPVSTKGSKNPLLPKGLKKGSSDSVSAKLTNGVAAAATSTSSDSSLVGKGGWSRTEWDTLRSLLVKYPRGTPKRWENVARELKTKRSTEEVIAAAKFMAESSDKDPYTAFAAQFQGAEKEALGLRTGDESTPTQAAQPVKDTESAPGGRAAGPWSEAQDKALLKAIKENPKGDSERWDKVAQAVTGRSKAECQKRLSELRDNLRARKAAEGGVGEEDVDAL